jgi:ribosomal protein L11 methyltransferase
MREGLIPHTVSTVLRLSTTEGQARALTELLGEMLDPTETAVSAFEEGDGSLDPNTNLPWLVEIYFASPPREEAMRDMLRPIVGPQADTAPFDQVTQKDWVKASLEGLNPVRAGRVLVHGSHDRDQLRANDISIEIEASLAFGTGHHGTTAGCLLALNDVLKVRRPIRALDVGTGTGILALALALHVKRKVVAGDIDAEAIHVSRANARLNRAVHLLDLYVAPGVRHATANRVRHFDLVMANILARPLMRLSVAITRVMVGHGTLILSGLLIKDVPGVLAAYRMQGLTLVKHSQREGWATLVLKRGGAGNRPRVS